MIFLLCIVLGLVPPSKIGITLTHEHLSHYNEIYCEINWYKPKESELNYANCDWTLENIGWIRQNP